MLIKIHGRGFARGADDHNAIRSFRHMKIDQRVEAFQVQFAPLMHGSNNRYQTSSDYGTMHDSALEKSVILPESRTSQ
jgi:hypothetical protein